MCPLGIAVATRPVTCKGSGVRLFHCVFGQRLVRQHRTGGTSGDIGIRGTMHFTYTLRVLDFGRDMQCVCGNWSHVGWRSVRLWHTAARCLDRHSPLTRTFSLRGLSSHAWSTRLFVGLQGSSERGCRLVGHVCPTCDSLVDWQDMSVGSCERTVMRCGIARLGRVGLVVLTVNRAVFFQHVRETVVWEVALHFIPFEYDSSCGALNDVLLACQARDRHTHSKDV